jgi:hypothetical protein
VFILGELDEDCVDVSDILIGELDIKDVTDLLIEGVIVLLLDDINEVVDNIDPYPVTVDNGDCIGVNVFEYDIYDVTVGDGIRD